MEQLRTRRTDVIVYAGGHFEIFETFSFVRLVLGTLEIKLDDVCEAAPSRPTTLS